MSIEAINWAFQIEKLTASERIVLVSLANYANQDAQCWPSFEIISKKSCLSRRHVIRQIISLEQKGFLKRFPRDNVSNIYVLNIERKVALSSDTVSPPSSDTTSLPSDHMSPPSDTLSPEVVTPCHPILNLDTFKDTNMSDSSESDPPVSGHFDLFWNSYPRKEKKKQARDVWKRKRLDKKIDEIVADIKKRKVEHVQWLDGYVPHATSYLNGERWNDEIKTKRTIPTNDTRKAETKCTIKDFHPQQPVKRASREVIEENLKKIKQHLPRA